MKTSRKVSFILILLLAIGGAGFQSCGHVAVPSVGAMDTKSGNGGGYEGTMPSIEAPQIFAYAGSCADRTVDEARIRKEAGTYYLDVWNCVPLKRPISIESADLKVDVDHIEYRGRVYPRVTVP